MVESELDKKRRLTKRKEILNNRREKAWRFRDRETSGSQALWSTFASLQGIITGIIAIIYTIPNSNMFSNTFLTTSFILTSIAMILLTILNLCSRGLDHQRASFFEITSSSIDQAEWPEDFDHQKEDEEYKRNLKRYSFWRKPLEYGTMVTLFANMILLYVMIHN